MKRTLIHLLALTVVVGCGSSPTDIVNTAVIVDEQTTVEPGRYRSVSFEVNTSFMTEPAIVVTLDSTEPVSVIVLNDANFALWEAASASSPEFDSGLTTAANIEVRLPESGIYHFVLSNRGADSAATATITGELFWRSAQ